MSINIGTLDIGVAFAGDTAGLQKATADAQQGIDRFGASTSKAMRQVREDTQGAEDALNRLSNGFKGAVVGASVAVGLIKLKNTAIEVGDALIQAQVQLDKLNNGFKFGAGGAAGGARELSFVREEANRLGLELGGAATQYMKMVAAARGTNMEGAKTRELFTSIAEASTVMGMSGEQSERAMMAVVQMMSKGKVQAEELRGQLGEHLPGAFAIAARAMGVTEVELNKLMETGQVLSADFLPKFAAQLRDELGGSVDDATKSMQASLNRFETAWLTFKQNVAQTGIAKAMGGEISAISDAITAASDAMDIARKSGATGFMQAMSGIGNAIGRVGFDTLSGSFNVVNSTLNTASLGALNLKTNIDLLPDAFRTSAQQVQLMGQKIVQAEAEYAVLSERLKQAPENIYIKSELTALARYISELERARAARDNLAGGDARQRTGSVSESRISAVSDAALLASQREKARAYAEFWTKNASAQAQFTAAVISTKEAMGDLFGPAEEAALREKFIKPVRKAKEDLDDFTKSAMRGQKLFGDLNATDGGLAGDFAEKWADLAAAATKYGKTTDDLAAAQAVLLKQQPFYKKGLQDEADALKEQTKATAEAAKVEQARIDAAEKGAANVLGKLQALQNEEKALVIAAAQNISLAQAIEEVEIARLRERQAALMREGDRDSEVLAIQQEIDARKKLKAAIGVKETREAADKSAKEAAEAWKKASEQIEKDITDALMRGFESGKGFAEVLRDTIVNMFKTLVLRPVVQATVQGGLSAIGLGGGAPGAFGTVSNGLSLYNAGSSALNWLGFGASTGAGLAATAGTGMSLAASAGGGLGLSAGASGIGLTGTAASGASLSTGLASGGAAASGGAMSSIAAAAPWVLGALAVVSLIKSLDDSGTMHTGGSALADSINGVREIESATIGFGLAAADVSSQVVSSSKQLASSALGILQGLDAMSGGKNKFSVATGFADDSSKDGAWGSLAISKNGSSVVNWADTQTSRWAPKEFADGEAGAKQYGDAVAAGIKQAIDTIDLPDWAAAMVEQLGDTPSMDALTETIAKIVAMPEQVLQSIGTSSQALADVIHLGMQASDPMGAGKAVADQITYGIEASLYQGFAGQVTSIISTQLVTPIVTAMAAGATITEAMASASIDTMKARVAAAGAAFAAIVGDPGFQAALADVGNLISSTVGNAIGGSTAPIAPDVYDPLKEAEKTADKLATTGKTVLEGLLDEEKRLRIQEAQAFGDTAEEIRLLTAGMSDFEREVFLSNRSLAENIAAQQRVNALRDERKSLEVELLQAQGNTAGAFAALTSGMGEAETAAYAYNDGLRAQIKGAGEATDLNQRLLTAQEDTAGLRALELAALEEVNRPLLTRIYALEDEAKAAEKAKEATEKLSASIASLVSAADNTAGKYLSGSALTGYQYARSAENINALGLGTVSGAQLQAAGISDIQAAVMQIVLLGNAAPEVKAQLLTLGASLIDLKQSAIDAAKATAAAVTEAEKSRQDQQTGLQERLLGLTKDPAGLAAMRELQIAKQDGMVNQSILRYIYLLEDQAAALDKAKTGTDNAYSSLERAVAAQRKAIDTQRAAAQSLVQEVTGVFDTLKSNVRDLFGEVDSTRAFQGAAGQQFISTALAAARAGGGLPDGQDLTDAIAAARDSMGATQYASQAEADFAKLVLANELRDLQDISGNQLSEAERQLKVAEDQLTALDSTLEAAKAQIDTLRGIDTSVISVEAAIAKLAAAIKAEKNPATAAVAGGAASPVAAAAAAADAAAATWSMSLDGYSGAAKQSINTFLESIAALPGKVDAAFVQSQIEFFGKTYAGIASYDVGTNVVPRDMLAQVHAGEMFVPAAYNPATSGVGNARLERLVEGLTAEVQRLQSIVNDGNQHQRRTADTLENVTEGGANMRTVTA